MNEIPNLETIFEKTWSVLEAGAPGSILTLATVDKFGFPQACSVVLRRVIAERFLLFFYTDLDSVKCDSLTSFPGAQLNFWDKELGIQIRLANKIILRQDDRANKIWKKMKKEKLLSYGKIPKPGETIDGPFNYIVSPSIKNFVVAECHVRKIDFLSIKDRHYRAVFTRTKKWEGEWVSP